MPNNCENRPLDRSPRPTLSTAIEPRQQGAQPTGLLKTSLILSLLCVAAHAEVNRVVIIKVDGLPERLLERYVAEHADGAREGHSRLPWIEHVFRDNGVWMENFYVRGLSISSPSWSLLDAGRHLEIRGNAEYDRYTLRVYDYVNFFPFYVGYARDRRADMPGVELLDENHIPLLIDRFGRNERYQGFQLYQRGVRWKTLEDSLQAAFKKNPRGLLDEWITGFEIGGSLNQQTERELIQKLADPGVRYLDYFTGDYDHVAHLTKDRLAQRAVVEHLDALVGRLWAAIETNPLASTTMLVMVSDHGMNTSEDVYSQGYNLIDWFNTAEGGGHHVLTNRHPMTEFKIRGLDPFVTEVTSPSSQSPYLAGEAHDYPTAVMDLDGNERASVSLRNNSLNIIHILLDQLTRRKPAGRLRAAEIGALFSTLDQVRPQWMRNVQQLDAEVRQLRARIDRQELIVAAQPKKFTGLDLEAKREVQHLDQMHLEERGYSDYIAVMNRLLALNAADFDPGKFTAQQLIPPRSLGDANTLGDLQRYVVGPSAEGMVVAANGSLDMDRSFRRVDYFAALTALQVRNNVQKGVAPHPVDFIAFPLKDSVWLYKSPDRQALIETRETTSGETELRYVPIAYLHQDDAGELHYDRAAWGPGFPLAYFEDPNLNVAPQWLDDWHTERDWLNAVHRTVYSNGIIGATEALLMKPVADSYLERKRELRRVDMIVFANDHWNFNVRGFNPGGNHGSLLRVSTHSVLLFAGGSDTGLPRGVRIATPYDSLDFVPTILDLMERKDASLPGVPIQELLPAASAAR